MIASEPYLGDVVIASVFVNFLRIQMVVKINDGHLARMAGKQFLAVLVCNKKSSLINGFIVKVPSGHIKCYIYFSSVASPHRIRLSFLEIAAYK